MDAEQATEPVDFDEFFFEIDSGNLQSVKTKLYGYCFGEGTVIDQQEGIDVPDCVIDEGNGAFVYVKRDGDDITVRQDFAGSYGLYLYHDGGFFALSNSLHWLLERIGRSHPLTVNEEYANGFLVADVASISFSDTLFNEIQILDRCAVVRIDAGRASLSVEHHDYGENTVELDTEEGMALLDRWHDRWAAVVSALAEGDSALSVDLSGGFDSRTAFSLVASSGADLNGIWVKTLTDALHTHSEDREIAESIAGRFGFELNDTHGADLSRRPFSLDDALDISLYLKLGSHKQFHFATGRMNSRRYAVTGNGGECVRGYWVYGKDEFERKLVRRMRGLAGEGDGSRERSVRSALEGSLDAIGRKYQRFGRSVDEADLVFNLFREAYSRYHFGRAFVEDYFQNLITVCPLLDPDVNRLRCWTEQCPDKNLLMAVVLDRYCPVLLEFKFDSGRAFDEETVGMARALNERFPRSGGRKSPAGRGALAIGGNSEAVDALFDRPSVEAVPASPDAANSVILDAFKSERAFELFAGLAPKEAYGSFLSRIARRDYYPLYDVYAGIAIARAAEAAGDTGGGLRAQRPARVLRRWVQDYKQLASDDVAALLGTEKREATQKKGARSAKKAKAGKRRGLRRILRKAKRMLQKTNRQVESHAGPSTGSDRR